MEVGGEVGSVGYLSLHCPHQNDSCIKIGSDESCFNVSLIVRDKVTKTVSTCHIVGGERTAESNRTESLSEDNTVKQFAS